MQVLHALGSKVRRRGNEDEELLIDAIEELDAPDLRRVAHALEELGGDLALLPAAVEERVQAHRYPVAELAERRERLDLGRLGHQELVRLGVLPALPLLLLGPRRGELRLRDARGELLLELEVPLEVLVLLLVLLGGLRELLRYCLRPDR